MTAPGRYAASDNSFTKSTANAAVRGGILIAIAVVIGVLLLLQGFDGGDPVANDDDSDDAAEDTETEQTTPTTAGDDSDDASTDETTSTTTAAPPIVVDPPNSVKVAVLNGRGEEGLAGSRSGHLTTVGYVSIAANADTSDKEFSRVYYIPGYADEAERVAVALNGSPSLTEMAPVDPLILVSESYQEAATDYHIYVVLGADAVLG